MSICLLDLNSQSRRIRPFFRREVATSSRNLGVENRFAHIYVFSKQRIRNITNNSTGSTGLLFRREVATSSRILGVEKYSFCHVFVQSKQNVYECPCDCQSGFCERVLFPILFALQNGVIFWGPVPKGRGPHFSGANIPN